MAKPKILRGRKELEDWRERQQKGRLAFVPTMGALHDGHLSLIDLALQKADSVIVSVFVNPAQFAPHEDFDTYPRCEDDDIKKLSDRGVGAVYLPSQGDIYPEGVDADIDPGPAAEGLESDFRPHFFAGVLAVIDRLFEQIRPDMAIFGEKDYQQLQVVKEFAQTRDLGIEIVPGPVIRDEKGLALSSRNAYLSAEDLETARLLNKILANVAEELAAYPDEAHDLITTGIQALYEAGFDEVDYVEQRWGRLLAAAWLGGTRLIDNVLIKKAA